MDWLANERNSSKCLLFRVAIMLCHSSTLEGYDWGGKEIIKEEVMKKFHT